MHECKSDDPGAAPIGYSPAFKAVAGPDARVRTLVVTSAHEGPVYVPTRDALVYTTTPVDSNLPLPGYKSVAIASFDLRTATVTTLLADSNAGNGMTLRGDHELLICEQGSFSAFARISVLDLARDDPQPSTLVDAWEGLRFNSPNDVVVHPDGSVWFTDPSYGWLQGFKPAPLIGDYVYRYDPQTGRVRVVADDFDKPNGIAFSPDGSTLYVTDSGAIQEPGSYHVDRPHHVRAFDVGAGGFLSGARLFAVVSPGIPDGLKCDTDGRVYVSSATGVRVYLANGEAIGEIPAAGVANFCFGGPRHDQLFMLVDDAILTIKLRARGRQS